MQELLRFHNYVYTIGLYRTFHQYKIYYLIYGVYVANSQDNLFQIFNDWKYKEALRNFRRTELSFLCEPHPVKLGGYNCSNPCIYGAKFKWDEADLDFSWASLETIVKVIETSEMLSAYAAMIKICVQKFMEDDDYFNTKHPVPSECFIGSTVGFWDM